MAYRRIHNVGPYRQEEALAAQAGIYPGMLLKLDSAGKVTKHTTEGGVLGDEILIAAEDALQGNPVETVYTDGAVVTYIIPAKGSVVNMLIEDGQNLSIAERVMSAGNGLLKSVDDIESGDTLTHVPGRAVEACDLTGSNTSNTLCPIRVC